MMVPLIQKKISLLFTLLAFTSIATNLIAQKNITIHFHHTIGNQELVLGDSFQNIHGEEITPQKFKYYLSNFSFTDASGKTYSLPVNYYLIDEADPASKSFTLNVPSNNIHALQFQIGVDSIRNISGIQTGALDPMKGMFWTWNSGYIMAKLEGSSSASKQAGQIFTYHIGGFKSPHNTIQTIKMDIPSKPMGISDIAISVDINQWFKSKSNIRITETPNCQIPGALAVKIAANYANQFALKSVN